jgi:hypothetical protein
MRTSHKYMYRALVPLVRNTRSIFKWMSDLHTHTAEDNENEDSEQQGNSEPIMQDKSAYIVEKVAQAPRMERQPEVL